jgi:hypothetical protein
MEQRFWNADSPRVTNTNDFGFHERGSFLPCGYDVITPGGVHLSRNGSGDDQLWGENRPDGWIAQVADGQGVFVNVAQTAFVNVIGAAD